VKVGCEYFAYLFRDVTKKMRDDKIALALDKKVFEKIAVDGSVATLDFVEVENIPQATIATKLEVE